MNFNKHSNLQGMHAFLSASKYSWLNYSEERLEEAFRNYCAIQRGTELHELASSCIRLGVKLPKNKKTLSMYVNDAIAHKMTTEQVLYFSRNCWGTADSISFSEGVLRIYDLKTGISPTKMDQLEIYAALFCLEYEVDPHDILIELRIYQSEDVSINNPDPDRIMDIMNKIVLFDKHIEGMKREERSWADIGGN